MTDTFKFVSGTPEWVKPTIINASQKHNVPTTILSALLKQESGFNPSAKSKVGALGIAQFMPETAKGYGINPLEPHQAIDAAGKYLRNSLNTFGNNMSLALASYNAGGGNVRKYGGIPPFRETQNYVKNIMGMVGQVPFSLMPVTQNIGIGQVQPRQTVPKSPSYFNPTSNQGNNLWSTPMAQKLGRAETYVSNIPNMISNLLLGPKGTGTRQQIGSEPTGGGESPLGALLRGNFSDILPSLGRRAEFFKQHPENIQFATANMKIAKMPVKVPFPEKAPVVEGQTQAMLPAKTIQPTDLVKTEPVINLKRAVPYTDISGKKGIIPQGEALTPYELKGNKILLKDGDQYIVNKNQYQNIKGQSAKAEAKEFAPELKQTTETILGIRTSEGIPKNASEAFNREFELRQSPPTKFSGWNLPGGNNYREILIQAPTEITKLDKLAGEGKLAPGEYGERIMSMKATPTFKSSHWEEPNVLAHLRLDERTYNGKKVTFLEEIQSDWAKQGRIRGFIKEGGVQELPTGYKLKQEKYTSGLGNEKTRWVVIEESTGLAVSSATTEGPAVAISEALKDLNKRGVPNNPLLKNWQELILKRALKEAVDNGSDYLSWTTGEQQGERYNLAKYIDKIRWNTNQYKSVGGESLVKSKQILIYPKNGATITVFTDANGVIEKGGGGTPEQWVGKTLDEAIPKAHVDKIIAKDTGELSGEGLKIGGEWASNLYDKQIPNILKDLTGQKAEVVDLGLPIKEARDPWIIYDKGGPTDFGRDLKISDLKVKEWAFFKGDRYLITDILENGKFKAVPEKNLLKEVRPPMEGEYKRNTLIYPNGIKVQYYANEVREFDLSQPKSSGQQAIKITPEIRALVKGEVPKLKQPSGVSPFTQPPTGKVEGIGGVKIGGIK